MIQISLKTSYFHLEIVSIATSSPDKQPNITTIANTNTNNEEEDDYIQCSLETVYTSTEMAVSPPHRICASQQTDNEYARAIRNEFVSLKNYYEEAKNDQHKYLINYHETILTMITRLQQTNYQYQEQVEQLRSEINNHSQDNEALKVVKNSSVLKVLKNNFLRLDAI